MIWIILLLVCKVAEGALSDPDCWEDVSKTQGDGADIRINLYFSSPESNLRVYNFMGSVLCTMEEPCTDLSASITSLLGMFQDDRTQPNVRIHLGPGEYQLCTSNVIRLSKFAIFGVSGQSIITCTAFPDDALLIFRFGTGPAFAQTECIHFENFTVSGIEETFAFFDYPLYTATSYKSTVPHLRIRNVLFENARGYFYDAGPIAVNSFNVDIPKQARLKVDISNSIFDSNWGLKSGALFLQTSYEVEIDSSTFINNYNDEAFFSVGQGSALFVFGSAEQVESNYVKVTDTIFKDNVSPHGGGAVTIELINAVFHNCTFESNRLLYSVDSQGDESVEILLRSGGGALLIIGDDTESSDPLDGKTAEILISDCIFIGNSALDTGGAVRIAEKTNVTISGSLFERNTAGKHGGAIDIGNIKSISNTIVQIIDTEFTNNSAASGGACYITNSNIVSFSNCEFTANNVTDFGGAIYALESAELDLVGGTFHQNTADQGGALKILNDAVVVFTGTEFTRNFATNGGALYLDSSNVSFTNLTFLQNEALVNGGGIFITPGQSNISQSNFIANSAVNGGAMFFLLVNPTESCTYGLSSLLFQSNRADGFGASIGFQDAQGIELCPEDLTFTLNEALYGDAYATELVSMRMLEQDALDAQVEVVFGQYVNFTFLYSDGFGNDFSSVFNETVETFSQSYNELRHSRTVYTDQGYSTISYVFYLDEEDSFNNPIEIVIKSSSLYNASEWTRTIQLTNSNCLSGQAALPWDGICQPCNAGTLSRLYQCFPCDEETWSFPGKDSCEISFQVSIASASQILFQSLEATNCGGLVFPDCELEDLVSDDTMSLLGDDADCFWMSPQCKQLYIELGTGSTVVLGDVVSFRSDSINFIQAPWTLGVSKPVVLGRLDSFDGSLHAQVYFSSSVGPCMDVFIDAGASTGLGGRSGIFSFTVSSLNRSQSFEQSSNSSSFLIMANQLTDGDVYNVSVHIVNWINQSDSISGIFIVQSTPTPLVHLKYNSMVNSLHGLSVLLSIENPALPESCGFDPFSASDKPVISWSSEDSSLTELFETAEGMLIFIPSRFLAPLSEYAFQVTITWGEFSSTFDGTFSTTNELPCAITGSQSISLRQGHSHSFQSVDYGLAFESGFEWTLLSNDILDPVSISSASDLAEFTIPSSIPLGNYILQLKCFTNSAEAFAFTDFTVNSIFSDPPVLSMQSSGILKSIESSRISYHLLNKRDKIRLVSSKKGSWECSFYPSGLPIDLSTRLSSTNAAQLVLPADFAQTNRIYQCSVTSGDASSSLRFMTSTGPMRGSFIFSPATGLESTIFTFTAFHWDSTALPLQYQLKIVSSLNTTLIVKDFQYSSVSRVSLPRGTWTPFLTIRDAVGSERTVIGAEIIVEGLVDPICALESRNVEYSFEYVSTALYWISLSQESDTCIEGDSFDYVLPILSSLESMEMIGEDQFFTVIDFVEPFLSMMNSTEIETTLQTIEWGLSELDAKVSSGALRSISDAEHRAERILEVYAKMLENVDSCEFAEIIGVGVDKTVLLFTSETIQGEPQFVVDNNQIETVYVKVDGERSLEKEMIKFTVSEGGYTSLLPMCGVDILTVSAKRIHSQQNCIQIETGFAQRASQIWEVSIFPEYQKGNFSLVNECVVSDLDEIDAFSIEFTISSEHYPKPTEQFVCAFIDPSTSKWSTKGCSLQSETKGTNSTQVVCRCTHLTQFAVLTQVILLSTITKFQIPSELLITLATFYFIVFAVTSFELIVVSQRQKSASQAQTALLMILTITAALRCAESGILTNQDFEDFSKGAKASLLLFTLFLYHIIGVLVCFSWRASMGMQIDDHERRYGRDIVEYWKGVLVLSIFIFVAGLFAMFAFLSSFSNHAQSAAEYTLYILLCTLGALLGLMISIEGAIITKRVNLAQLQKLYLNGSIFGSSLVIQSILSLFAFALNSGNVVILCSMVIDIPTFCLLYATFRFIRQKKRPDARTKSAKTKAMPFSVDERSDNFNATVYVTNSNAVWIEAFDEEHKLEYWFNPETKESIWERPEELIGDNGKEF